MNDDGARLKPEQSMKQHYSGPKSPIAKMAHNCRGSARDVVVIAVKDNPAP